MPSWAHHESRSAAYFSARLLDHQPFRLLLLGALGGWRGFATARSLEVGEVGSTGAATTLSILAVNHANQGKVLIERSMVSGLECR